MKMSCFLDECRFLFEKGNEGNFRENLLIYFFLRKIIASSGDSSLHFTTSFLNSLFSITCSKRGVIFTQ